jgi:hypothetical protein
MAKLKKISPKRKPKQPKQIEIKNPGNKRTFIDLDGEKYYLDREKTKKIDGVEHSIGLVYKKFDEKEYSQLLKTVVKVLESKTTKNELLTQLVKEIDMKTLRRLVRRIKGGKVVKRHYGCLGFKIGDAYVELIE